MQNRQTIEKTMVMLRLRAVMLASLVTVAFNSPALADLERALADYRAGDYAAAFPELTRLSEGSDAVDAAGRLYTQAAEQQIFHLDGEEAPR